MFHGPSTLVAGGAAGETAKGSPGSLWRALGYLRKYWPAASGAYLCLLLVTLSNLAMPTLVRIIIDQGIGGADRALIEWGALGMVALAALRAIFSFLQGYLSEVASQGVAFDLRNALYARIQSLSFSYHDRAQTGQLMTRATSDVEVVRLFAGMGLLNLLNVVALVAGTTVILFAMNWRLAALSLATFPFLLLITVRFSGTIRPAFMQLQQELGTLNTLLQENLAGVRVVKAFAREPYEAKRFQAQNVNLLSQNLRVARVFATNIPVIGIVSGLGTLAILWYGGGLVIAGQLSLGGLVAFNTYLLMLLMPMRMLGFLVSMLARASASAQRILEVLDVRSEIADAPGAVSLPPIQGRVCFQDVSFRYFGGEYVLKNINFEARPGQIIALLGATGSGKSTIINLIPRFYDATEGSMTIDGHDVRRVTVESLRRQIGIVLQETTLFSGTIRDNIAYGSPQATMEGIVAAARAARAHDFIVSFPQGYDTQVGERGVTLSGGQKQRIAIARALLLNPRILILDDSTSSVDFETEHLIQEALEGLMQGRTSFVIAQRLSTVRRADSILVLENGRIAARGTHQQLLEESPVYAEIYNRELRQAGRPGSPEEAFAATTVAEASERGRVR
ncbi:MAG: ABC transporter ATP-binding protein [Chloroflexota bacterium]